MSILGVQRRSQEIGRLRIGQSLVSAKGVKYPARLSTFRFTTRSRLAASAVAEIYGGTMGDWEGNEGFFEVITKADALGVMVPPHDEFTTSWMEAWQGGKPKRRCDGALERIGGGACICPHIENADGEQVLDFARIREMAANRQDVCTPVTRISVILPELPGLGVWRLDTGSFYALMEIQDAAGLLVAARDKKIPVPAMLRIDQRKQVTQTETKRFPVPVLEIAVSFRELASGALSTGGLASQLPPAPGESRRAITAPARAALEAAPPPHAGRAGVTAVIEEPMPAQLPDREPTKEEIVEMARRASTREEIEAIVATATAALLIDDHITPEPGVDIQEPLRGWLGHLWRGLPRENGNTRLRGQQDAGPPGEEPMF
jgi:hypothetical protein